MGGEVAGTTAIVRYAPGGSLSTQTHTVGEEYLVIDSAFQYDHRGLPVGPCVQIPPQSKHTERAENCATFLVKRWQFDPEDHHQMSVDTFNAKPSPIHRRNGASEITLYSSDRKNVRL